MSIADPRRRLPSVDALLADCADMVREHGRAGVVEALRWALDEARASSGGAAQVPSRAQLADTARSWLAARRPGPPKRVLNATGVVIHTNLGRAPLSGAAMTAVTDAAGACDVELDLATGSRGTRGARLGPLLATVTGAQDGTAVNNGAGALLLALAACAPGRHVCVSRGELVEIGGSFRLPEIMGASGARLREVGTTNRTRATDYDVDGDVAALLVVHRSNFTMSGFVATPRLADVAAVAARRRIPLLYDQGSGLVETLPGLEGEPTLRDAVEAGADLVVASGDKLLGGPQAGLIVGRAALVERCRRHPLARALRLDKLRIAALVATLEGHARGESVPVVEMIAGVDLAGRSAALAEAVGGEVRHGEAVPGGGAAPGTTLPGPVIRLAVDDAVETARRLRTGAVPVVARVANDAVWLDLRAVDPGDDPLLTAQLREALAPARE